MIIYWQIYFQYLLIYDYHNNYLFISNSMEDFKIRLIPKISADCVNAFSFYEVFCEQHHLQSVP